MQHKKLFNYIKGKYQKLLNRCSLYKLLKDQKRIIKNPFTELVKIGSIRDRLGRYKNMSRLNKMTEGSVSSVYDYLRHFYLKKLLLSFLLSKDSKVYESDFLKSDLQFPLIWNLFRVYNKSDNRTHRTFSLTVELSMDVFMSPLNESLISKNEIEVNAYPRLQFDECIPKSNFVFVKVRNKNYRG